MTTAHTPRTTLKALLVTDPLEESVGQESGYGSASYVTIQTVATTAATQVTWASTPLVQPTAPGEYLVSFTANTAITSGGVASGMIYNLTVNNVSSGLPYLLQNTATASAIGYSQVGFTRYVKSPDSTPVFGVVVSCAISADSIALSSRSLTWVKLA